MLEPATSNIVLSTLNARYIHSAFGLRYLKANLQELQDECVIKEFTLESRPEDVVEQLLAYQPKVIGLGVYIWNIVQITQVVALLKAVAPEVVIVLGGPEVSHENEEQGIVKQADYVITGWGEKSFHELCQQLLGADSCELPEQKIIKGRQEKLSDITMPYDLYDDEDILNRVMYVEASRGCPFKCEFCLSALDKTAWPFDLELFLNQMDKLYQRGARHFKFVDRTFNLKIKNSLRILDFFLERLDENLFLHFEVIPDHLPEALKDKITEFPKGSLQFEIGIQTFNPDVQTLISRRQDNEQAQQNIVWLRQQSQAHLHTDLIFGLPGESVESFAASFNKLYALNPHEIQVGILKRLKGSPIVRHTQAFDLVFNPSPPFSIVSNTLVDFSQVQFVNRFARYWDMIGNSGRFSNTLPALLEENAFRQFSVIVNGIYERTGQTHKISLLRLFDLIYNIATLDLMFDQQKVADSLEQDFAGSGQKSLPKFLQHKKKAQQGLKQVQKSGRANSRQGRH